jgi:hypothetical protein
MVMHEELIKQIVEDGLGTERAGTLARKLYYGDDGEDVWYSLIGWMYIAEKELVKMEQSDTLKTHVPKIAS